MNITRIVQNTAATLTFTTYEDGGQTDIGTITIGIDDQDGTEIVAAGTAVTDNADGTYEYEVTYDLTSTLGRWTVTWTEAAGQVFVTYVEIVGSLLVDEADLRTHDLSAMSSTTVYTDAMLATARDGALDKLEQWTGRSWIPRFGQVQLAGNGDYSIWLADGIRKYGGGGWSSDILSIQSATVSGTAVTVGNIVIEPLTSELIRTDGVWTQATRTSPRNITVNYTYGWEHPVDNVERIVALLVRDQLVATAIEDRAMSFSDELGTMRFTTPGVGQAVSSIPEVNEWVRAHRIRSVI